MTHRAPSPGGWHGLFWSAFKQSQNAMVLLDESRCHVEVNGAYLAMTGYRRLFLLGRPAYEILSGGHKLTEAEWQRALTSGDAFGDADVVCEDGHELFVEYAAHPEVMTGRRFVLLVVLHATARRPRPRPRRQGPAAELSDREREIVQLVAQGRRGPEIALELHISYATVRTHISNSQRKLGARSRAQLVAMAVAGGYLASPPDRAVAVSK